MLPIVRRSRTVATTCGRDGLRDVAGGSPDRDGAEADHVAGDRDPVPGAYEDRCTASPSRSRTTSTRPRCRPPAGPSSPEKPATPVPATVDTARVFASMRRTTCASRIQCFLAAVLALEVFVFARFVLFVSFVVALGAVIVKARSMIFLNISPVSPVFAGALLRHRSGVRPCRISAKLALGVFTLSGANSAMSIRPGVSGRKRTAAPRLSSLAPARRWARVTW